MAKMSRKHIATEQMGVFSRPGHHKCVVCEVELNDRRDNFHRSHYSELADLVGLALRSYDSPIATKEQYSENIVEIMVSNNLPFSYWDNPAVQFNQQCFMAEHGMTCSGKAMRTLLGRYSDSVKDRLREELHDRLFSIMFDIATRQNRRFLGIAVQFFKDWNVEIRYLGIKEITGAADADCIFNLIDGSLREFGLEWRNVYSSTTDCGSNVLKASELLLRAADTQEVEFVASQMAEDDDIPAWGEAPELMRHEDSVDIMVDLLDEDDDHHPTLLDCSLQTMWKWRKTLWRMRRSNSISSK